jgi:hypothetical protein
MADKVGPADPENAPDPSAVVGVLGAIERHRRLTDGAARGARSITA